MVYQTFHHGLGCSELGTRGPVTGEGADHGVESIKGDHFGMLRVISKEAEAHHSR